MIWLTHDNSATCKHVPLLNHTACTLALLGFGLSLPRLPTRIAADLLARLWSGGTAAHWLALTPFYGLRVCFLVFWALLGATFGLLGEILRDLSTSNSSFNN